MATRFGILAPNKGEKRVDLGRQLREENRVFFLQFIEHVTDELIDRLRAFFEENIRVPDYYRFIYTLTKEGNRCDTSTGEGNQEASKIHVGSTYNQKEPIWPSVLVSDVSANIQDLYLREKAGDLVIKNPAFDTAPEPDPITGDPEKPPEFLEIGERLTGKIDFKVTLSVEAKNKIMNDQVTDLLLYGMVGPVRRKLHQRGLHWLPNQGTVSAVGEKQYTTETLLMVRTLSFGLHSEWYDDFFYEGVTLEEVQEGEITLISA